MADDDANRTEGTDFTDIGQLLEAVSYPITSEELVTRYGDRTIERTNAEPIAIRELFDQTGPDTFESPEEIRQGLLNLMPKESVGRQRYSDRGGSHPKATEEIRRQNEDETL